MLATNEPSEKQEEVPATKSEVQKPQISQKPTSPVNVVPKRISPVRSPSPVTSRPQVQQPSPARTPQQETPLTVYNNIAPAQKEESPVRIPVRNQNSTNQRAPSPVRQEPPPQSPPQRNVSCSKLSNTTKAKLLTNCRFSWEVSISHRFRTRWQIGNIC